MLKRLEYIPLACSLLMTSCAATTHGIRRYESPQRQAVLEVVQGFFDTMTVRDVAGAERLMLPEGQYFGYRQDPEGLYLFRRTHQQYFENLATGTEDQLERMWDPVVLVHDRLAVVWTPYEFNSEGQFKHTGIDAFTLIKTEDGWRIVGTAFSMEPEGGPVSPFEPVQ